MGDVFGLKQGRKTGPFDQTGMSQGYHDEVLGAGKSACRLITEHIPALADRQFGSGYVILKAGKPIAGFAVYGSKNALSALPAQKLK